MDAQSKESSSSSFSVSSSSSFFSSSSSALFSSCASFSLPPSFFTWSHFKQCPEPTTRLYQHHRLPPCSGGSRILCLGGLTGRLFLFGGAKAGLSAEGAKRRLPKARSPSRRGGLGERRKLRQRGSGAEPQSPRNRSDSEHFKPKWSTFLDPVN